MDEKHIQVDHDTQTSFKIFCILQQNKLKDLHIAKRNDLTK